MSAGVGRAAASAPRPPLAPSASGETDGGARKPLGGARVKKDNRDRRTSRSAPYLFIGPAMVLFTATLAAPIVYSVYLSLRRVHVEGLGLGPQARTEVWVGLANYKDALTDPAFTSSALRVLLYGGLLVPTMLGLALLFALLLDSRRTRGQTFGRTAIFLPYAVPAVVASLLWGFLYLPDVSPFTYVLDAMGLPSPELLSSNLILFSVANIALWGGVGFNMIVLFTSLRSIPTELYEAARLDGAGEIAMAMRIKIPIVMPSLVMTLVFSLIATLQVFAEPTTLRPLTNNISTTWTPLMKVYRDAFTRGDVYSASATSVVIALVTFIFSFGVLRLVGNRAFNEK